MRIIISDVENGEVTIDFQKSFHDEEAATFPAVYSRLMAAMDGTINSFLKTVPASDKDAFRAHLYDILEIGFGNFLKKIFPEINDDEFDLTDAAIVYAQDQIIRKAEAEGKSYREMLKEYEALADSYVEEKRLQ